MGRLKFLNKVSARRLLIVLIFLVTIYFTTVSYNERIYNSSRNTMPLQQTAKPHVVFCILSSTKGRKLRDTQRKTWISRAMHADIPFRLTYKFLLDVPTTELIQENQQHDDIVYLNVTHHGRAVKFGEKVHNWMKIIAKNYPDALLSARIDDDAFLCVPQIFERLNAIKSSKLYYGWAHGKGDKIDINRRIDEMFVVLGKDLINRIAARKYCGDSSKCGQNDLIDTNYGGTSIGVWLSIYKDVDFYPDNGRILHVNAEYSKQHPDTINEAFCDKRLIYHKTTPSIMEQLDGFNKHTDNCDGREPQSVVSVGAVTGSLFSGDVIRSIPQTQHGMSELRTVEKDNIDDCDNWAVVTTIFSPSEAVIQMSMKLDWCLVVVADMKTPQEEEYLRNISSKRVKYLSIETQNRLFPSLSTAIPVNHFGRKNLGYMYAIQHNAKIIWDFDDDNIGIISKSNYTTIAKYATVCEGFSSTVLNPYPYFRPKYTRTWPRGFPLQHIKDNQTIPKICEMQSQPNIGIIQSLANVQPDVDAIYRLTHDMPFNFTSYTSHPPLVLPNNVFAPFNAQATLWMSRTFAYLALPISVNGRVSDIWRSYIAQHFMHKDGSQLAFFAPHVHQKRNEHMDIKDFNAEIDLYEKSEQLVDFLASTEPLDQQSLVETYKILYQRGYLEKGDLHFIEAWSHTLRNIKRKST